MEQQGAHLYTNLPTSPGHMCPAHGHTGASLVDRLPSQERQGHQKSPALVNGTSGHSGGRWEWCVWPQHRRNGSAVSPTPSQMSPDLREAGPRSTKPGTADRACPTPFSPPHNSSCILLFSKERSGLCGVTTKSWQVRYWAS